MKVKTILASNVVRDNVKDGKLEAGWYEIAFEGIMNCFPIYREYDGTMWKAMGDPITYYGLTMTVFVKVLRNPYAEYFD